MGDIFDLQSFNKVNTLFCKMYWASSLGVYARK